MIKKILQTLVFCFLAIFSQAQVNVVTSGNGQFAISSNTYSMFQTIDSFTTWNRSAYIYPKEIFAGITQSNASISRFEMFRDVSRTATGVKIPGVFPANASAFGKVWMAWTTDNGIPTTWDSVFIASPNLVQVFNADIKSLVGTTSGWKTFPLISPLRFEPNKNLIIAVEYVQSAGPAGAIYWAYDSTSVIPNAVDTVNRFKPLQMRFCHRPFSQSPIPVNAFTGSNIRRPTIKFNFGPAGNTAETARLDNLKLSPNPTAEWLNVTFEAIETLACETYITHVSGEVVQKQKIEIIKGENFLKLPVHDLAAGSYFWVLQTPKGRVSQPFVKY
jgi:hypothetical protein